jgi:hypothetical protein
MTGRLKRIESDRTWQDTPSFYESWRLPSSLEKLLQPFIGERKGTGSIAAEADSNNPVGGHAGSGFDAGRLENFDESMEYVEEEDLSDISDNDHSIRAGSLGNGHAHATTSFKQRQQPVEITAR